jgi:nicotinamidase-related amidase
MPKKLLLCIDLQRDYFPTGKFPLPGMPAAAKNAAQLLQTFRTEKQPVIHIRHTELDPAATFFIPNSDGAMIEESVSPLSGETVIEKNFPNSFRETSLEHELQRLQPEELVICGAMSNMCIDATVRAAIDLGFNCRIIEDACAAASLEFQGQTIEASQVHAAFMAALADAGAKVESLADLLR